MSGEPDRIVDEAEQEGEIKSLCVGYVIDLYRDGLTDDGPEQRRPWHKPSVVAEHNRYGFGPIKRLRADSSISADHNSSS